MREELLIPSLGASGAITGIMGVYLYRCYYSKIKLLISFGFPIRIQIPAVIILSVWFLQDFWGGIDSIRGIYRNVAFWAHVGGFAAGFGACKYLHYEIPARKERLEFISESTLGKYGGYGEGIEACEKLLKDDPNNPQLADWVEKRCGPMEGGRSFFQETVVKNLRLGRFLTLIVGDKIRQSVIEMLNYYSNKYPHLATDIALVELYCYRWTAKEEKWPLLVVPNIVARTEIVERSVVQVTINPGGTYQIESQQEKARPEPEVRKRVTLTEEAFWELLKKQTPDDYAGIPNLIDKYRRRDGIEVDPTESAIVVRLYIQDTGQQVALFFVATNAEVWVWPRPMRRQLEKAGFDPNLVDSYRTQIRQIFNLPEKRIELGRPVRQVNVEKFTSAVDAFIQNIQVANPIND